MDDLDTTAASIATYRNGSPYPFCPGCGHGGILDALDDALVRLQLDPAKVVIVSDIGCVGLGDQYFVTSSFHGLHGRAITYATGIKLARPELHVVVIMGDGGCGIGGAHLLAAARRNVGIAVLVFNNLNFGMTGGQQSATTPEGGVTATTPWGNPERPLDVCATVGVNGAGSVYRGTVFDDDLAARIAEAIAFPGFALLDVWELCTAYYVPNNTFSRKALVSTLERLRFATGVLHREERPEFMTALRGAVPAATEAPAPGLVPRLPTLVDRPLRLVLAGSAGGRVRSAAGLLGSASVLSGLRFAERDDYPVTVKTGHSLSEIILSPDRIDDVGIEIPDALVVVSAAGCRAAMRHLAAMTPEGVVFSTPDLAAVPTRARRIVLDPALAGITLGRANAALVLLTAAALQLGVVGRDALEAAAAEEGPSRAPESLRAIAAGALLARQGIGGGGFVTT